MAIFAFSIAFTLYGMDEYNGTGDGYGLFAHIYFFWGCFGSAFAFSLLFYFFASAVRYFRYPQLIMKKLTLPIEGNCVQDFVLWWQFRRYYIQNDVRLTRGILNSLLSGTILISAVLLLLCLNWFLKTDIEDQLNYVWKVVSIQFVIMALILYLAQNATLHYEEQLKHKWMLTREKLRIEAKMYDENDYNDDGDMRTRNDEQLLRVIDAMIADIETTVIAIEMGGVKITPGIMLLIRGYIASGVVAMAATLF